MPVWLLDGTLREVHLRPRHVCAEAGCTTCDHSHPPR